MYVREPDLLTHLRVSGNIYINFSPKLLKLDISKLGIMIPSTAFYASVKASFTVIELLQS